ncbi:sensor domain-containing diguanylate cyclase [Aliivibrio sp. S3MY1]|uniref:sensor domain-containing diguanylate cyclase n=1 Tax=unclassified Aliivibrio TaxID=2645654 RepID=UPI0023780306|nr:MULTISPECIES: sensor domain-containing diguanylate cyclase [unclassified Aliivibrio]MDD9194732.1 sensor domain-containing diguanylate cyclase [Aliivibrio sp. S3MY1]MDD9198428.1 sensor domain-containing diguanylate cyclase [Aliivibrio sp. S2MY1]
MLNKVIIVVSFFFSLLVTESLVIRLVDADNEKHFNKVIFELNKSIGLIFNDAVVSSEVLKEVVNLSKGGDLLLSEFNRVSKALLDDYNNVNSILLLPNGIVSYVYPYEENKNAIGHDVLNDENRKLGSLESILKKEVVIIGPVKLVQNGKQAFIIRKTILNENNFWGFVSSIVYLDSIIDSIDNVLLEHGVVDYSIVGYNPDNLNVNERMIRSKGDLSNEPMKSKVHVFNTTWEIYISQNSPKYSLVFAVFIFVSIVFLMAALLFKYINKNKNSEKEKRLLENEAHADFLTGLLNRRGFENRINILQSGKLIYGSIAIFDIDFFKKINDTYGHDVGDEVLVKFTNICMMLLPSEYILSRSGGDEFILLMPELDIIRAEEVCECLRLEIYKEKFTVSTAELELTTSIGVASYSNIVNIRSALNIADKALYLAKNNGRNRVFTF